MLSLAEFGSSRTIPGNSQSSSASDSSVFRSSNAALLSPDGIVGGVYGPIKPRHHRSALCDMSSVLCVSFLDGYDHSVNIC